MRQEAFAVFILGVACASALAFDIQPNVTNQRFKRAANIFQIISFPNDACAGSSSKNGTCYTSEECTNKGGTSSGSCANGYGVCCVFSVNCGQTIAENCTYFENTSPSAGACALNICKCDANVCQLRLDFDTFVISGPSTLSESVGYLNGGQVVSTVPTPVVGFHVTEASQCATDTFSVTSPGNKAPPTICGTNSGQHMYVDAAESCNTLGFQLGTTGVGTSIPTRRWNIKVTQYTCDHPLCAPPGCTQYFFGATTGTLQSYNYAADTVHLASQEQTFCIRRENGNCRTCFYETTAGDFNVGGLMVTRAAGSILRVGANANACCKSASSVNARNSFGKDCVMIPNAEQTAAITPRGDSFCGRQLGTGSADTSKKTVCTRSEPYTVRFLTNEYENFLESNSAAIAPQTRGLQLSWTQSSANCA